jgi:hypothetical protein
MMIYQNTMNADIYINVAVMMAGRSMEVAAVIRRRTPIIIQYHMINRHRADPYGIHAKINTVRNASGNIIIVIGVRINHFFRNKRFLGNGRYAIFRCGGYNRFHSSVGGATQRQCQSGYQNNTQNCG